MTTPAKGLLPLLEQLKKCASQNENVTEKVLREVWGSFRQISLEHGDTVTPAVMAGVILFDKDTFAPLLNEAEHAQLLGLGKKALEHYQQLVNPPNKLGKTIAAVVKESI